MKIVAAENGSRVMTIFIRDGETAKTKVPLGSYRIKYAAGAAWFGAKKLFGPGTYMIELDSTFDFGKTETGYSGYTIELFKQAAGNLKEKPIPVEDFEEQEEHTGESSPHGFPPMFEPLQHVAEKGRAARGGTSSVAQALPFASPTVDPAALVVPGAKLYSENGKELGVVEGTYLRRESPDQEPVRMVAVRLKATEYRFIQWMTPDQAASLIRRR